ncbi:MAG: hypothetical protein HRU00_16965 [Myxococcales bacterium]|nr:hypothetical protein [Myxococcales bacterium]
MPTQLTASRIEVLLNATNDGEQLAASRTEALLSQQDGTGLNASRLEVLLRGGFLMTASRIEVLMQPLPPGPPDPCAGKPGSYFIMPDQQLVGEANVLSVTSESGPYTGAAGANTNNLGKMIPIQAGRLGTDAEDLVYKLVAPGGRGRAEWIWRRQDDTGSDFFGANDPRMFYEWHSPITSTVPGSDNCATIYASEFRRLLVIGIDDTTATSTVIVAYRDVDTDGYDEWTTTSFSLTNKVLAGHHNCQLVELADKRLALIVRVISTEDTAGTDDFDVYHSLDGGLTWTLVAAQIAFRAGLTDAVVSGSPGERPNSRRNAQIRVAVSGEHIRLAWVEDTFGIIRTLYSADRGISFKELSGGITTGLVPTDTDDVNPFDLVGVGTTGLFLLMKMTGVAGEVNQHTARRDAIGYTTAVTTTTPASVAVRQILLIDTPDWVYNFTWYDDRAAGIIDAWMIRRSRPETANDFASWEENPKMANQQGTLTVPCRVSARWMGNAIFFYGARKNEGTGTDIVDGLGYYWGGWSQRSFGEFGPSTRLDSAGANLVLFEHLWHQGCGRPDAAGASVWVETTAGGGSASVSMDSMELTGVGAADVVRYSNGPPLGEDIGNRSVTKFYVRLDTGDSVATADNVAVRLRGTDGQGGSLGVDVSLRVAPAGITIFDNTAASVLQALAVPGGMDTGSTGAFFEVRFSMRFRASDLTVRALLAIRNTRTNVWTVGTIVVLDNSVAVTSSSDFGHFGQVQVDTMRSWWREFSILFGSNGRELRAGSVFVNPDDLLGQQTTGVPIHTENGLLISWAGIGGALNDAFNGEVEHQHPAEAVLIDSPRIDWRSSSVAAQTMILDADPDDGLCRWDHDAIAVFGTNDRFITVEYDDNAAFASPVAAGTIDTTAFGTGTQALFVTAVEGCTLETSNNPMWVVGEVVGHYVRMTSGTASGLTFKVTRHASRFLLHCGDETTSLAAQGVLPGDSFVVFADHGVLVYSSPISNLPQRYMRLGFSDSDTAEDDHSLGRLVVGRQFDIAVPLDWAFTDDEQPNITQYRTRGGITWAFQEGPDQRTIIGRIVGDAERWRDRFRYVLRQIGYEKRSVALVIDDERGVETVILGRVKSGSRHDNAAWYRDADGNLRKAGDTSLMFTEET